MHFTIQVTFTHSFTADGEAAVQGTYLPIRGIYSVTHIQIPMEQPVGAIHWLFNGTTSGSNSGLSILAKDTSWTGGTGIKPLIFQLVDNPLYFLNHSRPNNI